MLVPYIGTYIFISGYSSKYYGAWNLEKIQSQSTLVEKNETFFFVLQKIVTFIVQWKNSNQHSIPTEKKTLFSGYSATMMHRKNQSHSTLA